MLFSTKKTDDSIFLMSINHQSEADDQILNFSAEVIRQDNQNNYSIHINNTVLLQNHRKQYQAYFNQIEETANQRMQQINKLSEEIIIHNIIRMNNQNKMTSLTNFKAPKIQILGSQYHGMIINYEAFLGNFKITISMLNKNIKAPNNLDYRGQGGYGTVYNIQLGQNKNIVCKRSYFRKKGKIEHNTQYDEEYQEYQTQANKSEIEEMISEYAFYKICSFYRIGPSVVDCLGFDLICFRDSIEFYMEECYRYHFIQSVQTDLMLCLRILHKMNIIHKDIKPANILYSNTHKSYILADFGISHPVQQKPGQYSKTYKQGTPGYMCEEMNNLQLDKWGYVDLYYNDMFGLTTSIKEMSRYFSKQKYVQKKQDKYQRINKEYATIKLLYMILNVQQLQVIEYIKQYDLYKEFFYELGYIKYLHPRYKLIVELLITQDRQLIKYKDESAKTQKNNEYFQKRLCSQQIGLFVRVYGMTDQLILELEKYESNQTIENIKQSIKSKMIIKRNSPSFQYQKIISGQFRYIRYLEKQLQAIQWEQLFEKNKYQKEKINIYLAIFNFKIRYSLYYSQLPKWYQLLSCYVSEFSLTQNIQYQFYKILMRIIHNKCIDSSHRQTLRELLKSNPKQALNPYRIYLQVISRLLTSIQIIKQCELFYQIYQQFKLYCHIQQFLDISIFIIRIGISLGKFQYYHTLKQQLENILVKNYDQKHYLFVDFLFSKAEYLLQSHRIESAIQTFKNTMHFIKELFGQNSFKFLTCNLYLGICYFYSYEFQKSQLLLLETLQKIKIFYDEFNSQYLKCIQYLIQIQMKRQNLLKIQIYYSKLRQILKNIYIDFGYRNLDICIKMLKFYFKHNLIQQANKFMLLIEQTYSSSYLNKSSSQYNFLILKKQWYVYTGQKQNLYKILAVLKKIMHEQYLQSLKIRVLREVAVNYSYNFKQYDESQTIFQYIIKNSKSYEFFHIESIMQLGKLVQKKQKSIMKAYNYIRQSYDLFKKSQIYNLVFQIRLVYLLGRCLLAMHRHTECLELYIEMLRKVQNVNYLQGKIFLKLKIAQLYLKLKKYKKSKKQHILILKELYKQTPNFNENKQFNLPKNIIYPEQISKFQIYEACLGNLYLLSKKRYQLLQAVYYFQKIRSTTETICDLEYNVYLGYYKKYSSKSYLAYRFLMQQIKMYQYTECTIHCKWIYFFLVTKNKINTIILLTLLFEVIGHTCQYSMLYYPLYKKNYQEIIFKRCRSILKSSKVNKTLSKNLSQSLKKIALYKKIQFLNRKLSLSHSIIKNNI